VFLGEAHVGILAWFQDEGEDKMPSDSRQREPLERATAGSERNLSSQFRNLILKI